MRRGDKIEMLVMYCGCGEIIKIASYQCDVDNPIQISFENVGVFRFPESVDEITKKKANCLSKFAFCSINEVRLYFYILLAKLI